MVAAEADRSQPRRPVPAASSTDELITGEVVDVHTRGGGPAPSHEGATTGWPRRPGPTRPGPSMLPADTWSQQSTATSNANVYRGLRRADPLRRRAWLSIAVALIGLSAAIALPLALTSHGQSDTTGATSTSSTTDTNGANHPVPASPVPATGDMPSIHTPPPSTTLTDTIARSPTSGSFPTLTLEAENAAITQPARAVAYPGASGRRIVIGIGIGYRYLGRRFRQHSVHQHRHPSHRRVHHHDLLPEPDRYHQHGRDRHLRYPHIDAKLRRHQPLLHHYRADTDDHRRRDLHHYHQQPNRTWT